MTDHRTNKKGAPIHTAIKLLDPEGTLVPGTQEYKDTEAMVTNWIDKYGPAQAFEMIRKCVELVEGAKKPYECADLE